MPSFYLLRCENLPDPSNPEILRIKFFPIIDRQKRRIVLSAETEPRAFSLARERFPTPFNIAIQPTTSYDETSRHLAATRAKPPGLHGPD